MPNDADLEGANPRYERWVPWASFGLFVVGLYGGYTNGGGGGFLAVWIGAGGLSMATLAAEEN